MNHIIVRKNRKDLQLIPFHLDTSNTKCWLENVSLLFSLKEVSIIFT